MTRTTSPAAFDAFEAVERGRALKYTAAWVGPEAAQDIVQEGLLVVWQKWDTLTNPSGYLFRTCRQLAFAEYEARNRGPALVAELPDRPYLNDPNDLNDLDDDRDALAEGAAIWELSRELAAQKWSCPHTPGIAIGLAVGTFSRAEIAEAFHLPLSEVHRSARELRRYYEARRQSPEPTVPENGYTPHGLVMQAMRRLSRREREVMALAALGLKPHLIAPLIGITSGSARATLCHARKSVADTTGYVFDQEGGPDVIDTFVWHSLDTAELVGLLPNARWKAKALWWATAYADKGPGARSKRLQNRGGPGPYRGLAAFGPSGPNHLADYLTEISKVLTVVREGLEASDPVASYGSVRWTDIRPPFRPFYEPPMYAVAYRRRQPYDTNDYIPPKHKMADAGSDYFCPTPSRQAMPPRFLVPARLPGKAGREQAMDLLTSALHMAWRQLAGDMGAHRA